MPKLKLKSPLPALGRFVAANDRDLMLYAGLALFGYGVWPLSPEAALAIPGAIVAAVAVFGVRA